MLSRLLNFLFPSKCPVCGNNSDSPIYNPFCSACWAQIKKYDGPACGICGIPAVSPHTISCESCLKTPPLFSKIVYYGIYEETLKKAIHLLKFSGLKRLSWPLSLLMLDMSIPAADCVVPVPLHKRVLQKRGFNQTAMVGRHIAKNLNIPLRLDVLEKIKHTPPQTYVTGKERLRNIKGAFRSSGDIKGARVLLVDDVITTGATVRECSKVLIKGGAENITVLALARSVPKF